jgi:signal transduction histidine kinase
MTENNNKKLIDEILKLSKEHDDSLTNKLLEFIEEYKIQKEKYDKILKQNQFFIKKWDKKNILIHEQYDKKDKIIEQQSRLAAMGEMMDAVAHQWKQPLNAISIMVDMLKDDFNHKNVDEEYIEDLNENIHMQIDHMVATLKEFRNFLRPSTKNEEFYIQTIIDNVKVLMKDELISQNLQIHTDIEEDIKIFGNKNEFKHLFINLINNSIDAFNEREIKKRDFYVRCYTENTHIYIEIEDNAGGIPENIIDSIFKPNITTKPEDRGTGIGLYMSAQIVKKHHGNINVHNTKSGTFFTIILYQSTI